MNSLHEKEFLILLNSVFHPGRGNPAILKNIVHNLSDFEILKKILSPVLNEHLKKGKIEFDVWLRTEITLAQKHNVQIIDYYSKKYPKILKTINDPPLVLYCKGNIELLNSENCISIVGSRRCNSYGAEIAEKFSGELSDNNITIVSGLALGIDRIAHDAALAKTGNTIAVLGGCINNSYPHTNLKTYKNIVEHGLVISEFPFQTAALKVNFPVRNRIIAGLSKATLVVQAQEKSGTLITARLASEYGRDVMAVPGDIRHSLSSGTNKLILDGAYPAITTSGILEYAGISKKSLKQIDLFENRDNISHQEKKILGLIESSSKTIDEICERTGLSVSVINVLVMELIEKELVVERAGRRIEIKK